MTPTFEDRHGKTGYLNYSMTTNNYFCEYFFLFSFVLLIDWHYYPYLRFKPETERVSENFTMMSQQGFKVAAL